MGPTRSPGFPGEDPPMAGDPAPDPGGVQGFGVPAGFGEDEPIPLETPGGGGSGGTSTLPANSVELSIVAEFKNPWSGDIKKELAQLAAKKWWPGTVDFKGVAGSAAVTVKDAWGFLFEITKSTKPIGRLNFFSHGSKDLIALTGDIDVSGDSVSLGLDSTADPDRYSIWTQIFAKSKAIVDPYAKTWGTEGENAGTEVTIDKKKVTLTSVRGKFASGAVLWLYVCHGAQDPMLAQQIANVFQITAKGFSKEIVYCVGDEAALRARKHKIAVKTAATNEASCANAVDDFHKLDSHSDVRTSTPKSP